MRTIKFVAAVVLLCATSLWANSYGSMVSGSYNLTTNGIYGCYNVGDNWPCASDTKSSSGSTKASVIATDMVSSNGDTNPATNEANGFASVSVSEGHIGLSLSADTVGIGIASASGNGSWYDVLTVNSDDLQVGTWVQLQASLGITAEFVDLGGVGSGSVDAAFTGPDFHLATSGYDATGQNAILPPTVTEDFWAQVGENINLSGSASGSVYSTPLGSDDTDSSWSLLATNSAHFSITSADPDIALSLASGCDITSGYGCDTPPGSSVPEPCSLLLLGTGVVMVWSGKRKRTS